MNEFIKNLNAYVSTKLFDDGHGIGQPFIHFIQMSVNQVNKQHFAYSEIDRNGNVADRFGSMYVPERGVEADTAEEFGDFIYDEIKKLIAISDNSIYVTLRPPENPAPEKAHYYVGLYTHA